jgi:hypothetical protein
MARKQQQFENLRNMGKDRVDIAKFNENLDLNYKQMEQRASDAEQSRELTKQGQDNYLKVSQSTQESADRRATAKISADKAAADIERFDEIAKTEREGMKYLNVNQGIFRNALDTHGVEVARIVAPLLDPEAGTTPAQMRNAVTAAVNELRQAGKDLPPMTDVIRMLDTQQFGDEDYGQTYHRRKEKVDDEPTPLHENEDKRAIFENAVIANHPKIKDNPRLLQEAVDVVARHYGYTSQGGANPPENVGDLLVMKQKVLESYALRYGSGAGRAAQADGWNVSGAFDSQGRVIDLSPPNPGASLLDTRFNEIRRQMGKVVMANNPGITMDAFQRRLDEYARSLGWGS